MPLKKAVMLLKIKMDLYFLLSFQVVILRQKWFKKVVWRLQD